MRGPCPCPHAGIDLIAAFYGCLYAGCVPVTVRPPHPQNIATTLPTVKMIVEVTLPRGSEPASREARCGIVGACGGGYTALPRGPHQLLLGKCSHLCVD